MQAVPFILKERYSRIECPIDGYEGLWFNVRMNLSNGELQALREALRGLDDRVTEISEVYLERADALDERRRGLPEGDARGRRALQREITLLRRACEDALAPLHTERRNLVAPYIQAWNLYAPAAGGAAPEPVPPPRDNPEAMADLGTNVVRWLCQEVLTAYTGGRGFLPGSGRSGSAPEPGQTQSSGGPQICEPLSSSPTSRKKSRRRLAST